MSIRADRLREIADGAMGIGAPLVLTQAEQVEVCTELLACREERDAARAEAERLRAELLKSDTLAWEALGKPGGTFASTTVERLVMAHGIIKGEVGRLLAELAAVKRQRDELLRIAKDAHALLIDGGMADESDEIMASIEKVLAAEQPKPQQPEVQP